MQVRPTTPANKRWQSYSTRREAEQIAAWKRAAWQMFWLLVFGKLGIMIALAIVTFRVMHSTSRSWSILILLNWSWIVLAVALVVGPIAYWWRLRRVRRKRKALIYAEWHID